MSNYCCVSKNNVWLRSHVIHVVSSVDCGLVWFKYEHTAPFPPGVCGGVSRLLLKTPSLYSTCNMLGEKERFLIFEQVLFCSAGFCCLLLSLVSQEVVWSTTPVLMKILMTWCSGELRCHHTRF